MHIGHSPGITHSGRDLRHSLVQIAALGQTGFSGLYPKPPRMESAHLRASCYNYCFPEEKAHLISNLKPLFFNVGTFHHVSL